MDYFDEPAPKGVVYIEAHQIKRKADGEIRFQTWLNPKQNVKVGDKIRIYRTLRHMKVLDVIGEKDGFKLVEMVYGY